MEPIASKLVCSGSYKPFKECPNRVCKSDHFGSFLPGLFGRIQECQNQSCNKEHIEKKGIRMHQVEYAKKWFDEDSLVGEKKPILIVREKWKDQFYTIEGFVFWEHMSGGSWGDPEFKTTYTYRSFTFLLKEVQTLANGIFAIFAQESAKKNIPYLTNPIQKIIVDYAVDPLDLLNQLASPKDEESSPV
jgi:hypothetical protein